MNLKEMNNLGNQEKKLVKRINRLYHDLDANYYDTKHRDILVHEKKRWSAIFDKYLIKTNDIKLLDYGCGTGF